ncbi:MAG TPA: folate-binding protein [Pseudolysinimonas sp.]|nr:folate-binding protein [Pseudolysinimonas sp.]
MSTETPFAARPAAVTGETGVPLHYGNPLVEQRALDRGDALVDLSDRSILSITGPDRLSWLDSLTSQSVATLTPGESAETLLLDPSGRIEYAARVLDDGETTWLLLDAGTGDGLLAFLTRMRFMLRVEVADRVAEFATVGVVGDAGAAVSAAVAAAAEPHGIPLIWRDPWSAVVAGGHQYAAVEGHPASEWSYAEVIVPRAGFAELAGGQVTAAGTLALEALRVAAWRPRAATEVDATTIPHELDWLRSAVHLSKGCYRGQETVAKVHNLGHPPRRLVLLHLDGSDGVLPAAGDPVSLPAEKSDGASTGSATEAGREVGRITAAVLHYELGPIALAVIKRSVDPAVNLVVSSGEGLHIASQQVIVPTDAGAEVDVPRLPRLGAVKRS